MFNKDLNEVVPSFDNLTTEEMEALIGEGDIQAETTPACAAAAASSGACAAGAGGFIVGATAIFSVKQC
ncbi:mersacidin family lantibiotic [Staphylococcus chromogenes]|uniref:lichenicidin A2 family type 2 lantibiotic n=1 Tax=Staphylococcus TaxID=1279 RepID=UPI002902A175|nr:MULTISPECIES: mersacidin family lantibiotic [Staphylococcus]MDU0477595.1 mersacidin family lantibiotic [Staphylococcus chromogenes]MEB6838022.1 mersacidin family lantibiotic [Staphylococcus simulans]